MRASWVAPQVGSRPCKSKVRRSASDVCALAHPAHQACCRWAGVDPGIRDCLQAGKQCGGYAIAVEKLHRQRIGSFWLDSLNFRRETVTTGWRVDVLLVFVDDALVYKLVGGRPTIHEVDLRRNPLGPLQGWGDQSLQLMKQAEAVLVVDGPVCGQGRGAPGGRGPHRRSPTCRRPP